MLALIRSFLEWTMYLGLSGRVAAHAIEGSRLHGLRNGRPESGSADSERRSHFWDKMKKMGEGKKWTQSLGRKRRKKGKSGRSSFAALQFSRYFPSGRITAGTVTGPLGTPWKGNSPGNFPPTVRSGCRQINFGFLMRQTELYIRVL